MKTHWGRVTHICISKLIIIGSDNGLSPERRQAIIWTIAGILLIGTLGTNFSQILSEINTLSFKKMHLKMLSAKWRQFCLSRNVLNTSMDQKTAVLLVSCMWLHFLYAHLKNGHIMPWQCSFVRLSIFPSVGPSFPDFLYPPQQSYYTPRNEVRGGGGVYWIHPVCLSVSLSVCLSVCPLTFCVRPVAQFRMDSFHVWYKWSIA